MQNNLQSITAETWAAFAAGLVAIIAALGRVLGARAPARRQDVGDLAEKVDRLAQDIAEMKAALAYLRGRLDRDPPAAE